MKRPSHPLARRRARKFLFGFAFLFLGHSLLQADLPRSPRRRSLTGRQAGPAVRVVNGRIKKISADEKKLEITHLRPATGKIEKLILFIDEQTGFKKDVSIQDFNPDDPVSVDYRETKKGSHAVQIRRVPLQGVPEDIRRPF